jgi:hypothetical protein
MNNLGYAKAGRWSPFTWTDTIPCQHAIQEANSWKIKTPMALISENWNMAISQNLLMRLSKLDQAIILLSFGAKFTSQPGNYLSMTEFLWFASVSHGKCRNCISNKAMTSFFHILFNSLFTTILPSDTIWSTTMPCTIFTDLPLFLFAL